MKKLLLLVLLAGAWLPMANAYVVSSDGTHVTTEGGDTLWKISADLCGNGAKWRQFKSSSKIGIGEIIAIPDRCRKPNAAKAVPKKRRMEKAVVSKRPSRRETTIAKSHIGRYRVRTVDIFMWTPAVDSVKTAGRMAGPNAVKYVLDGMGGATIAEAQEVWEQINRVGYNATVITQKDGTLAVKTRDGEVLPLSGTMVGGHSVVSFQRVRLKGTLSDKRATVLFGDNGKVVVKLAVCDNIVTVRQPKPVKVVEGPERNAFCVMEGTHVAEYGKGRHSDGYQDFFVGTELACLHDFGNGWKIGPLLHVSKAWFKDNIGGGYSSQGQGGVRFHFSASDGSEWEVDVAMGPGDLVWKAKDKSVKLRSRGLDAYLGFQWMKWVKPNLLLEVLGYVNVPITNTLGDVVGQGWVEKEKVRRPISGGIGVRAGYDFDPNSPILLEGYAGFFFLEGSGGDGVRLTLGVRSRDRSIGAWVGVRLLFDGGRVGIIGVDYNWGDKALYLDGKGRQDENENAQVVSVDTEVKAVTPKRVTPKIAKTKTYVKVNSGSGGGSPFGWAADAQTSAPSYGYHHVNHTTSTHVSSGWGGSSVGPFGY